MFESVENSLPTWPVRQTAMSSPPAPANKETTVSPCFRLSTEHLLSANLFPAFLVSTVHRVNNWRFDRGFGPTTSATVTNTVLALFSYGRGTKTGSRTELQPKAGHIHLPACRAIKNVSQTNARMWLGNIDLSYSLDLSPFIATAPMRRNLNSQV